MSIERAAPVQRLSAAVVLRNGASGQVGLDRIALLKAIGARQSIAEAAKAVGLSYRAAWDAVQALNNLVDRPLVITQVGGRQGGFAKVTPEGEAVIAAYGAVQEELAAVLAALERRLADPVAAPLQTLLWSLSMKTSARNALRGVVERITDGAVNAEVVLALPGGAEIVAIVTRQSVADLGLEPGRPAIALIKSSFVILATGDGQIRTSARNSLAGTVVARERGAVNDEITLQIAEGKTLTAIITHASADTLDLEVGARAVALIKASHVILAVE